MTGEDADIQEAVPDLQEMATEEEAAVAEENTHVLLPSAEKAQEDHHEDHHEEDHHEEDHRVDHHVDHLASGPEQVAQEAEIEDAETSVS